MSQAYDRAGAQQPAGHPRQPAALEVIAIPGHGVRSFAERVADQIARDSSTLRYSTRLALLADARRQGIRRFDANLIIAAVQERTGGRPTLPKAPAARRGGAFVATAATFLLVQAAIVLGAGMLLLS